MQRHQFSYSAFSIILLVISLIAINVVFYFIPFRLDITEEKLYTISDGTKKILSGLEEPLSVKFYFSKSSEELPPNFKSYAQRVGDLLKEYSTLSNGQINLEIYDPKPDTEEEEWAQKYGISQVSLPSGEALYFGMVAIQLDREAAIPFFDPRRQEFLEYDISQVIYKATTSKFPKIGVISPLKVMGSAVYPPRPNEGEPKWAIIEELEQNFEVEELELDVVEIPDDISLLLIIHPKDFNERLRYAIDQYVLRGGRLVLLVDPNSRHDLMNSQMPPQYGQRPNPASALPKLFETWGIEFDKTKLVGDTKYATPVNAGNAGVVRYPIWLSLTPEALDENNPITSELESLLFIESGTLKKAEKSSNEFTTLISSTSDSGLVDSMMTQFGGPANIIRSLKIDDKKKTIAALIRGTFDTAYPGGQPPKPEKAESEENAEEEKDVPLKHVHLNKAKETNTVLIIADVDFITDSYSVQRFSFLGQRLIQPTNDNLNLVLNAIEYLSGNDALMSIRSRGRFSRPFTHLTELEQKAQSKHKKVETELQEKLREVRAKLRELEQKKDPNKRLVLTAEQQKEIKNFRDEELKTKRRLREVRKILRQDIESLGNWLLTLNLLVIPSLVFIAGLYSYAQRTRKRRKPRQ